MIGSKRQLFMLGASVLGVSTVLGTVLWLTVAPRARLAAIDANPRERLMQYGAVPEFSLTERSGQNITLAQLRGKIWIADFIYTSCTDTCPLQTGMMAKLQEEFAPKANFQLVSVTVDPERDTPAVLARYAARHNADAKRWFFLTGQRDRIIRLIQDGFHLSVTALPDGAESTGSIPHSPRFVLIDQDARIRGYYDSRELEAFIRLKNDLETLLKG
jgi:cytochrome oxidase Cu insertion factor (SCO1/SenC/PrrC family)